MKKTRRPSLRRKLTITTFLVGGAIAVVASAMFFFTIRSITSNTIEGTFVSLQGEVEQSIGQAIASIDNTAHNVIQGESVYSYLSGDVDPQRLDELELFTLKSNLEKDISRQLYFNPAFESGLLEIIRLCLDERNVVFRSRSTNLRDQNDTSVNDIYRMVVASGQIGRSFFGLDKDADILTFAYNLASPSNTDRHTVLLLGTDKRTFLNHYQPLLDNFPSSRFLLSNQQGEILLANDDISVLKSSLAGTVDGKLRINGKLYRMQTHPIAKGAFQSTILVSERELTGNVTSMLLRFLLFFLTLVAVLLFGSYLFFSKVNVFANDFIQHIRKVGNGDFSVTFPPYGDDDLDQIGQAFNAMAEKINSLIEGVYKKQLLIQQMDLRLLQSQMNPHFLFNVLFSISTRAKMIGDETLYEMTTMLAKLLRTSLNSGNETKITLEQELDYVISYLKIQRIRFGERLRYELRLQDDTILSMLCPRLSLQPLVENAVVHGIEPSSGPGCISIRAYVHTNTCDNHIDSDDNDIAAHTEISNGMYRMDTAGKGHRFPRPTLVLSVTDNGVGFDSEHPPKQGEGQSNHIALQNLRERIRLLYGPGYGLEISSTPGKGCTATISIPVERKSLPDGATENEQGGGYAISSTDRR